MFSSSCATFGLPDRCPISEDAPQRPINPYGASKLMVERMLADFGSAHGLVWTALSYFNAAGADTDCEFGEEQDPRDTPDAFGARRGFRASATCNDFRSRLRYTRRNLYPRYILVTDLAEAHVLALQASEGRTSAAYNLGNGRGFSVREVTNAVERVTGLNVPTVLGERRAGDPPMLVSGASAAHEMLGWQPRITEFDDIVRTAWAWHQRSSSTQAVRCAS